MPSKLSWTSGKYPAIPWFGVPEGGANWKNFLSSLIFSGRQGVLRSWVLVIDILSEKDPAPFSVAQTSLPCVKWYLSQYFLFSFMAHMRKFYLNNSIRSCWIIFKISETGWRCWRAESATDRSSPRNGFEGESNLFKYSKNINQFLAWKFSRENTLFKE